MSKGKAITGKTHSIKFHFDHQANGKNLDFLLIFVCRLEDKRET